MDFAFEDAAQRARRRSLAGWPRGIRLWILPAAFQEARQIDSGHIFFSETQLGVALREIPDPTINGISADVR